MYVYMTHQNEMKWQVFKHIKLSHLILNFITASEQRAGFWEDCNKQYCVIFSKDEKPITWNLENMLDWQKAFKKFFVKLSARVGTAEAAQLLAVSGTFRVSHSLCGYREAELQPRQNRWARSLSSVCSYHNKVGHRELYKWSDFYLMKIYCMGEWTCLGVMLLVLHVVCAGLLLCIFQWCCKECDIVEMLWQTDAELIGFVLTWSKDTWFGANKSVRVCALAWGDGFLSAFPTETFTVFCQT